MVFDNFHPIGACDLSRRTEVKAAAQAMEGDDDTGLVMTRDGVIHYIGPSLKTMCERGEGRA